MPFDAAEVIDPDDLAFDFTAYEGPKGQIPEPSREKLDAYWAEARRVADDVGLDVAALADTETPEGRAALVKAYANAPEDALQKMKASQIAATAELCNGQPSEEVLRKLPFRIQEAFFAWLMGKFSDPTKLNGASSS